MSCASCCSGRSGAPCWYWAESVAGSAKAASATASRIEGSGEGARKCTPRSEGREGRCHSENRVPGLCRLSARNRTSDKPYVAHEGRRQNGRDSARSESLSDIPGPGRNAQRHRQPEQQRRPRPHERQKRDDRKRHDRGADTGGHGRQTVLNGVYVLQPVHGEATGLPESNRRCGDGHGETGDRKEEVEHETLQN